MTLTDYKARATADLEQLGPELATAEQVDRETRFAIEADIALGQRRMAYALVQAQSGLSPAYKSAWEQRATNVGADVEALQRVLGELSPE